MVQKRAVDSKLAHDTRIFILFFSIFFTRNVYNITFTVFSRYLGNEVVLFKMDARFRISIKFEIC